LAKPDKNCKDESMRKREGEEKVEWEEGGDKEKNN
jgi:hypothetical protein